VSRMAAYVCIDRDIRGGHNDGVSTR
jgi:hypothetical protein